MKTDLEIAREAKKLPITEIAKKLGLNPDEYDQYGKYIAKIDLSVRKRLQDRPNAKYIVVSAITPTPLGEGKTTTTVGLGQAMHKIGKNSVIAIRQPSMGPTFGIKGGAAGGGYAQVIPMEEFNLNFTGDIHAITASHNLVAAIIDNHLLKGNKLKIDPDKIIWPRVLDVSDRALRKVRIGDNKDPKEFGIERETRFDITVASEIMAILALANDLQDLKARVARTVVAYNTDGKPVTIGDLKVAGSVAVIMKDAIKPNLVQTLDNTPAIIHAGPFANIAHGNSSIIADLIGIKMADYLITEAGFGADIGMEKFMNIKCRYSGLTPDAVIIVATVRALKYHSGKFDIKPGKKLPKKLIQEDIESIEQGIGNLAKQIENTKLFGVPVIVAINRFPTDTDKEVEYVKNRASELGADQSVISEVFAKGADGGIDLATAVVQVIEKGDKNFKLLYDEKEGIKDKISKIAQNIYGANSVKYTEEADKSIELIEQNGMDKLPICMAKTHLSLSDDPTKVGRPTNFDITVREVKVSAGAGFIVAMLGKMRLMPGLSSHPNAQIIDIDEDGNIVGLS